MPKLTHLIPLGNGNGGSGVEVGFNEFELLAGKAPEGVWVEILSELLLERIAFIILFEFILSALIWVHETDRALFSCPPNLAIYSQEAGMLFTAGRHGKSCWLVFFFQSRVLPYVDLRWYPLNHLKVVQTKLTMVASAPAIDLMVDVNRLYAITSIFCILSLSCDLIVLLLSLSFICSCSMINFCLFSNA